jgi:hypothetical protein
MEEQPLRVSTTSDVTIPIRNLIAIICATAMLVMGYFNLTSRISLLERDYAVTQSDIELNSEFRIRWPRGELGALPDDAEQNIRLSFIDKKMVQMDAELEEIKNKLHEQK